ncbi:MAG TPA: oxidoreductase [Patescibacteria group bacterium]|nr:oxidoreductase [Patescibacteria group bacterium]
MLTKIDDLLNSITMYRLVLYYLIGLLFIAFIYSIFHVLPFGPNELIVSTFILVAVSYVANKFFAYLFKVQTNYESFLITALILVLIITPGLAVSKIEFLIFASILSMLAKYILNIKGKHIFNPAAIALVITAFTINGFASWWIATRWMFPFLLLGFLIVRKIRRESLVFYFFVGALISTFMVYFSRGDFEILKIVENTFLDSPILFFAFVMLTEPLTTPPTANLQALYGVFVGLLFAPLYFGRFYTTPEIALSIGNVFSYLVSPKEKLTLKLKEKIKLTSDIYDFVFVSNKKINFTAGQYLEWTFGHKNTDSRGNRRYFTISSSPTENDLRIGIKFPKRVLSSYKKQLLEMKNGDKIIAGNLAGDFTLKENAERKLVFVAGGIGVTPYRSIIKYLIDKKEKCDVVLVYFEKNKREMVYKDVFKEAKKKIGLKIIYFETEKQGHMIGTDIKKEIPDYKDRIFYLSGPHGMVTGFQKELNNIGLSKQNVKVDYFPGF